MGGSEAKAVLRAFYEGVNRGDPDAFMPLISDDIVWRISGTTVLSGLYRGKQEVVEKMFAGLRARLEGGVRFDIERVIGEDDIAVLQASGAATSKTGAPYNNEYCIVARVRDGKLVEMRDYIDTELITTALGA